MTQALVPLKDLVEAKSRLSGLLRPSERRALAQAMAASAYDSSVLPAATLRVLPGFRPPRRTSTWPSTPVTDNVPLSTRSYK